MTDQSKTEGARRPSFLRDAPWLTPQRMRAYIRLFCLIAIGVLVYWVASADGMIDKNGTILGSDFLALHSAGALAAQGDGILAYDGAAHYEAQRQIAGGHDVDFAGYYYPPHYLLLLAALGALPYLPAFFLWMAASFAAAFAVIRTIVPRRETLLFAIGFPGTLINFTYGQNGFLSTALLGGALVLLDRRPIVSGILFGLMTYKPHLGVLVPFVLLATGRWTVIASAGVTTLALLGTATLVFGIDVWPAMMHMSDFARVAVLESGALGWHKLHSVFAVANYWGADTTTAYVIHAMVAITLGAVTLRAWMRSGHADLNAALLLIAALMTTPYGFSYDLTLLGLVIAFLVAHGLKNGFAPYAKSLLALSFALPILTEPLAEHLGVHITPFLLIVLFAHTAQLALGQRRPTGRAAPAPAQ